MEDQLDPPRVLQDGENVLLLKANNVQFALTQLQQLVRLSHKSLATDTLLKEQPKASRTDLANTEIMLKET